MYPYQFPAPLPQQAAGPTNWRVNHWYRNLPNQQAGGGQIGIGGWADSGQMQPQVMPQPVNQFPYGLHQLPPQALSHMQGQMPTLPPQAMQGQGQMPSLPPQAMQGQMPALPQQAMAQAPQMPFTAANMPGRMPQMPAGLLSAPAFRR